jgi:DNA-binding Xre family transcriptional regulator
MSLATAIDETMRARGLRTVELAKRLGLEYDRATLYRMLSGATKEPRLGTLVQLCIALETSPSELLELAGVWAPGVPGGATAEDLRLRGAFRQVRALPMATQQQVAPLIEALATAWVPDDDEQILDEGADSAYELTAADEA